MQTLIYNFLSKISPVNSRATSAISALVAVALLMAATISVSGCGWDNRPVRTAGSGGGTSGSVGTENGGADSASQGPVRNPDIPDGTPSFRFGDIDYVLVNSDDVVNQYIPFRQTLGNWTSMFALRKFPGMTNPADAADNVTETLKLEHPETKFKVTLDPATGDSGIDFVIWTPDQSLTEFDVHIYQRHDFGVMGKMFLMRGYGEQGHRELLGNVADNKQALTKAVFGFNFPVFILPK